MCVMCSWGLLQFALLTLPILSLVILCDTFI